MVDPLPLRLHRAVSILARSGDPLAADAQSACSEVAARLVQLEEALASALNGGADGTERARMTLARP